MGKTRVDPMQQAMDEALASVERLERESAGSNGSDEAPEPEVEVSREEPEESEGEAEEAAKGGGDEAGAAPSEPTPEAQIASLNDQLLRLAADFENFRKRARREQEDLRKFGVENAVRAMLPVVDNLERALFHAKKDDPVAQGVRMVAKQFQDVLGNFGVLGFDSVGQPFNPELHEAMGQQPAGDAEAGTVLEELERGYRIHDRLLRPAKVIVAAAHEDTGEGAESSGE